MKSSILGLGIILFFSGCLTPTIKRNLALEYFNIGNAYFSLGKHSQAVEAFQKALFYNPELAEGSLNLARVYFALDRFEEGIKILNELRLTKGDNIILLETLAYGLARTGQKQEAIQYYSKVLEISPGNENSLHNLGVLYFEKEQFDTAFRYLHLLFKLDTADPVTLKLLGQIEVRRNRMDEALKYFFAYFKQRPEDVEIGKEIYRILWNQQRFGEALITLESLLLKKPDDAGLWFEKALLLLTKAEEKKDGLDALEKALSLGFQDKQKFRTLLVESPIHYIEEIRSLLLRKGVFPAKELEEFLKRLSEQS